MELVRNAVRSLFSPAEKALDAVFGSRSNPLHNLGALGFFFYWIVAVSGIYLYIFFDTGIPEAFESVEALTTTSWCGRRAATRDWLALTSPTETPWMRTRPPAGGGLSLGSRRQRRSVTMRRKLREPADRQSHQGEPRAISVNQARS